MTTPLCCLLWPKPKKAGIEPPEGMLQRVLAVIDALQFADENGTSLGYAEDFRRFFAAAFKPAHASVRSLHACL